MTDNMTMFEYVGGIAFFEQLVDRFYEGVETDPLLRPMYPDDLEPGKQALMYFLAQYWGGPTTYSEYKGPPRLRMRHMNFRIGDSERAQWFHHMKSAVQQAHLDDHAEAAMLEYFEMAARHLVNTPA